MIPLKISKSRSWETKKTIAAARRLPIPISRIRKTFSRRVKGVFNHASIRCHILSNIICWRRYRLATARVTARLFGEIRMVQLILSLVVSGSS